MKIRSRLNINTMIFVVVLAIISTSIIIIDRQVERINRQEETAQSIELKLSKLNYLANDYFIYYENQQIEQWESSYDSISADVSSLNLSEPETQLIVNRINENLQRLKGSFEDAVSRINGVPNTILGSTDSDSIQVFRSRLAIQTQGISFDVSRLGKELRYEQGRLEQIEFLFILILMGAITTYLLLSYYLLSRRTLKAVSNLQEGADIVGSGNLDYNIEVEHNDEIGELTRAFNRMTTNLKTVTTSKEELEKEITERKRAEEELRQSEERFYKIFNQSPDMIAILRNHDNTYIDVNQIFLDVLEYEREEVLAHTPQELRLWGNNNPEPEVLLHELKENEKLDLIQFNLRSKSGRDIIVLSSTMQIELNNEDCRLAIMKDITNRIYMEQEILRLDRLNLIGEMAVGIGHEIRNPMTAVRGFLQMLSANEEYNKDLMYFDIMIEELDRANAIISEYLSVAKNKKVELQYKYLDSLVDALYPMLVADANIQEKMINLDLHKPPMSLIDESEIRQLILNMARNGLEAMPAKGTLTIGTMLEDKNIVLFIKDEGPGLSPEILDRLGTPFFTTKDNGTGLGLAICYSIAARHSARIDFNTGPSGTTFYIRFPIPGEKGLLF